MGSMFVGKVLMSMYGQPAKAVVDGELAPIKPGAWAAWAKSNADEQAATQVGEAAPAGTTASTATRVSGAHGPKLATGVRHG